MASLGGMQGLLAPSTLKVFSGDPTRWPAWKVSMLSRLRSTKLAGVVNPPKGPAALPGSESKKSESSTASATVDEAAKELFGHYANYPECKAKAEEREQVAGIIVSHLCEDLQLWADATEYDGKTLSEDGYNLWRALLQRYETHSASSKSVLINSLFSLHMRSDTVVAYDNTVSEMTRIFSTLRRMDFCLEDLRFILLSKAMPNKYQQTLNGAEMNDTSTDEVIQKMREQVARSDSSVANFLNVWNHPCGDDSWENQPAIANPVIQCGFPGCGKSGHSQQDCFRNPASSNYKGPQWVADAKARDDARQQRGGKGKGKKGGKTHTATTGVNPAFNGDEQVNGDIYDVLDALVAPQGQ